MSRVDRHDQMRQKARRMADDADSPSALPRLKEYWNARARRSGGEAALAVGLDDPIANACIEAVQRGILVPALRQAMLRTGLRGASVLDVGCGGGRWIGALGEIGASYVGVDLAVEMLTLARVAHPAARLAAVDAAHLPFGDASFDLVWSVAAIHHNPYEVQERIAEEMRRVLRERGALLLFEGVGARSEASQSYWPRPLQDWLAMMRRHGLVCVWRRGARYRVLGSALEKVMDRPANGVWGRAAGRVDVWLDPLLQPLLPARYQKRAALLFVAAKQ